MSLALASFASFASFASLAVSSVAHAAPDAFASCDDQRNYYAAQLRPRPADRPTLWWIENAEPCPYGIDLVGAQPPEGRFVGCEDGHGRRYGWRTEFGGGGKVALETHWDRNREIGPRIEWDPLSYEVVRLTSMREGRKDGEMIEWLSDGGVVVTTFKRGLRDGPTWRLDDRGNVLMVESWRGNERDGRACTWRGDLNGPSAAVEQVYSDGQPALMW